MTGPVEIQAEEELYRGFLGLKRYRLRHRLFAGGTSPPLVRERVESYRAASVLLYDPVADQVVLIEQFRIGALEAGEGAWLLEVIGGIVDDDEPAEEVARREALEEAGCRILELLPICRFYVSPGYSSEQISLFCGRVDAASAGGIHGLEEEGEDIRVVVLPAEAALAELDGGRANSTSIVIALQWLALKRRWLRREWGVREGNGTVDG
ncbi:MAG TPA: NUDIX domain-containing protein [Sedimenticola thiotaurini]|uniref:ADP-ribose pyrophosphatase n=1 Tax=Sedimenticola thiotaurini TaxID=1543721 RepID=A0A831RKN2_9GAMM|nr:NUDIX domain-containing protein [Sedimenticola thiotaurini]